MKLAGAWWGFWPNASDDSIRTMFTSRFGYAPVETEHPVVTGEIEMTE